MFREGNNNGTDIDHGGLSILILFLLQFVPLKCILFGAIAATAYLKDPAATVLHRSPCSMYLVRARPGQKYGISQPKIISQLRFVIVQPLR